MTSVDRPSRTPPAPRELRESSAPTPVLDPAAVAIATTQGTRLSFSSSPAEYISTQIGRAATDARREGLVIVLTGEARDLESISEALHNALAKNAFVAVANDDRSFGLVTASSTGQLGVQPLTASSPGNAAFLQWLRRNFG